MNGSHVALLMLGQVRATEVPAVPFATVYVGTTNPAPVGALPIAGQVGLPALIRYEPDATATAGPGVPALIGAGASAGVLKPTLLRDWTATVYGLPGTRPGTTQVNCVGATSVIVPQE